MIHIKRKDFPVEKMELEQINKLLLEEELSGKELAWQQGLTEWVPLFKIPGVVIHHPPPIPEQSFTSLLERLKTTLSAILLKLSASSIHEKLFDPLAVPPANTILRILAVVLDYGLIISAMLLLEEAGSSFLGLVVGVIYLLVKDGLFNGASIGKGLLGIRVLNFTTARPCKIPQSCVRNGILILAICSILVITSLLSLVMNPEIAAKAGGAGLMVGVFGLFGGLRSKDGRTNIDSYSGTYVVGSRAYREMLKRKLYSKTLL